MDERIIKYLVDVEDFTEKEVMEHERLIKGTLMYKRLELHFALKDVFEVIKKSR